MQNKTRNTMQKCKTQQAVFNLIENLTLEQMEAHKRSLAPMVAMFQVLISTSKEANEQRQKIIFMDRCLSIAIEYVKDQEAT
jgi:hypothetical protein